MFARRKEDKAVKKGGKKRKESDRKGKVKKVSLQREKRTKERCSLANLSGLFLDVNAQKR